VRELENLIQRACVLASGNVILAGDLPFDQSNRNESEWIVLERAAKRFLQAAAEAGVSPVALALRVFAKTALAETGNDEAAAALLRMSKEELLQHVENRVVSDVPTATTPAKKGKAAKGSAGASPE